MEVVHERCAGLDISKKDAKVCVRIAGAGRQRTTETVTTWGSMTNQILALRDHLIGEPVTCAVMEATGDYWKPFYYLLENGGSTCCWSTPGMSRTCPDVRRTSRTRPGWLSSARTVWSVDRSCHPNRSGSYGI